MAAPASPGQVITFYSYKGGTGRSMSLANVACLLAERVGTEGNVLLVDWDLEAPGLHRFFPGRLSSPDSETSLGLDQRVGLIDLFMELDKITPAAPPRSDDEAEERATVALDRVDLESFVGDSGVTGIRLIRAGRDDDDRYSQRVTTFSWEGLFHRSPALFRALAERWARTYQYVLLDSRTGVGDISGICTSLLPEKLVVVFTPNHQSLTGIKTLVERATTYRRQSDDLRPLVVFPLPSRIEATREDLRAQWRLGNRERRIKGYQPMFEELLAKTYGLPECKLAAYFDQVQIQQTPDYAYGEEIAVRAEQATDRFSLSSSFRVFTDWLVNAPGPWRRQSNVDTLIETLKERVGAESLGREQRRGLEEIVGKLEESVKREAPVASPPVAAPSPSSTIRDPGPRYDVFLSFASHDRLYAERLAKELERRGHSVWWDHVLAAGSSFSDQITRALDASRMVVVLWSRASVDSQWVKLEAEEGLRRGAVLSAALDESGLPLGFRQGQAVDLRRWASTGSPADLEPLFTALGSGVVAAPPPAARRSRRGLLVAAAVAGVVVLGGGTLHWMGWTFIPGRGATAGIAVPTLVGRPLEDAILELTKAGLKIGRTETVTVMDARPGTVLRQSPAPGDRLGRGSAVDIFVATPEAPPRQQQKPAPPEQK